MPEGDSIFRAARTLHRALAGALVTRFESMFPALTRVHDDAPLTGRTVESVQSIGKHILMRFSGDLILRTHMRMNGSWHIYRPGEPWKRPRRDMRIIIGTTGFEAIGFNIPVAEFMAGRDLQRHDIRRSPTCWRLRRTSFRRVRACARPSPTRLNQRVAAGGKRQSRRCSSQEPVSPRPGSDGCREKSDCDGSPPPVERQRSGRRYHMPDETNHGNRRSGGTVWVFGARASHAGKCGTLIDVKPQGTTYADAGVSVRRR